MDINLIESKRLKVLVLEEWNPDYEANFIKEKSKIHMGEPEKGVSPCQP